MAGSPAESWSNDPNAPQIPYSLYFGEKANFAGFLIGAIFYGIVVVLFFQCMTALLNPVNRAWGGIKWPLVAHTAAMFSFATIYTAMNLNLQSIAYIDNREFPGEKMVLPGPLGYQFLIYSKAISVVPNLMYMLNNWLADGLLLYRCYVIYARNCWVITFPCLMYLASVVMGIMVVYYQASQPDTSSWSSIALNFNYPYFSIALSLNLLLTLMVVARLAIHSKNVRNVTGQPAGAIRLCITILIESCALYAASFMLFIGPWGAQSRVAQIFYPMLSETQVIAPFLITLRVANRSALTSDSIVSGSSGPIQFRSQGKSADSGPARGGDSIERWRDMYGKTPSELSVVVETTVDLHHDMV